MNIYLKRIIKKTPLFQPVKKIINNRKAHKQVADWERKNRVGAAPHLVKQRVIKAYAQKYNTKILVETGTFLGDMVDAMKDAFDEIYSIEISDQLYKQAVTRFENIGHIILLHGDSGKEIKNVLKTIKTPALFWLDGHYSGGVTSKGEKDTPILEELGHIFSVAEHNHVIIIDDARCFGSDPAYPSIDELKQFVSSKRDDLEIHVEEDSIRITPGR